MKKLDAAPTKKENFPAISGFRNIAWLIFIYHFIPFDNPKYPEFVKDFVSGFQMSLDMFFILSGFLITYRYFDQKPLNFKKYMVNRIARIYPMYFLITLAVFVVWYLQNGHWNSGKTTEAILSFTMTKALFAEYALVGIPQGWSLTLEEIFYFSAPLLFILIRKSKIWLIVAPSLIVIAGYFLKNFSVEHQLPGGFMQANFAPYAFDFFTGIGLAIFIKYKSVKPAKFPWATLFGVSYVLFYFFIRPHLHVDFKNFFNRSVEIILFGTLGIAPILWGLMNEKSCLQTILSTKPMVLLGKSSYIFYLIHKGFIPIFLYDHITDNFFFIFIILSVLSVLLFLLIEEPMNNFIRKKFGKPKQKLQVA